MSNDSPFETKSQSLVTLFFLNILLAVVIFCYAELGRLLGIQGLPLAISVVWPATGFALAALLLFGNGLWPGIFLGNFFYNFVHLYEEGNPLMIPVFTAAAVTLGSLLEALVGNYLMRRYASPGFFNTVHDVLIFLVPAGILASLIAPTIGVATLYLQGSVVAPSIFYTWLTFLVGDSMGVYIFTPLAVVWTLFKPPLGSFKQYKREIVWLIVIFSLIAILTFVLDYSVRHFYMLIAVWAAYRFGMHGATFAIFIICLGLIIPTSLGYGLVSSALLSEQLIVLVTFLEIIVATALILAAVVKEREMAWILIKGDSDAFELRHEERKVSDFEELVKEKLVSLGLLTVGIARRLHIPLKRIGGLINQSIEGIQQQNLEPVKSHLQAMEKLEGEAAELATMIEKQAVYTTPDKIKMRSININMLVHKCVAEAVSEATKRHPELTVNIVEEFDEEAKMTLLMPEDLSQAIHTLMGCAMDSMQAKKERMHEGYAPILKVKTTNFADKVEIVIHDNGEGVSESNLKQFYSSFMDYEYGEEINVALAFIHDIIIYVYRGEIKVSSQNGEYLRMTIVLSKELK